MAAPTLTKNPTQVKTGPGNIYVAPSSATDPTFAVTSSKFSNAAAGFYSWGYTNGGITISFGTRETGDVTVDQELRPIRKVLTGIGPATVSFNSAGVNQNSLKFGLNGGNWAVTGTGATAMSLYTPSDTETRCKILWVSDAEDEIFYLYQAYQTGEVSRSHQKGEDYADLEGLVFEAELTSGLNSWVYGYAAALGDNPTVLA